MNNGFHLLTSPLISVIIPVYNRIPWAVQTVQSVVNQRYKNVEILLVDDGSTESLAPLEQLEIENMRIIHQKNSGPAAARNKGMKMAAGDYILFIDSDDLILPGKIEHQLKVHLENPDVWLSHTSYQTMNQDGMPLDIIHSGRFSGNVYPQILWGCPISISTVLMSRIVVDNGIWADEDYRISEDIIFFSKIAKRSKLIGIDIPYLMFRVTNNTHANLPMAQVKGSLNIIHYLKKTNSLDKDTRRLVFSKIQAYISINYYKMGQPWLGLAHKIIAFWFKGSKFEIFQRAYRKRLSYIKRGYLFIRSHTSHEIYARIVTELRKRWRKHFFEWYKR